MFRYANVFVLNLANHSATTHLGCEWANQFCGNNNVPTLPVDLHATPVIHQLNDLGSQYNGSSVPCYKQRVPYVKYIFRAEYTLETTSDATIPEEGQYGQRIASILDTIPVCVVTGDPGAGKTRDVPFQILGAVLNENKEKPVGIAVVLDFKDAQNALYNHIITKHNHLSPWIGIWNGDTHEWPSNSSFVVLCTPVSYLNRLLKTQGSSIDINYKIYDEVHAASPWLLFLLSFDIYKISMRKDKSLKIILMTATTETSIFKSALALASDTFVTTTHTKIPSQVVTHPDPEFNPSHLTKMLPNNALPSNFSSQSMARKVSMCIQAMVRWAMGKNVSASILVLVPGEKEMDQLYTDW